MKTRSWTLALTCALAVGCGGQAPSQSDSSSDAISLSSLPQLPGCAEKAGRTYPDMSARPLAGSQGLYVIYTHGTPLCIDTLSAATETFHTIIGIAASNPMPGDPSTTGSNPMPGDPSTAGSNPMPGDPGLPKTLVRASSNPMPGDTH